LLTFSEGIAQIAQARGRSIRYVQVPMEEYVIALEQAQLPQELIGLIKYLFTEVLDGPQCVRERWCATSARPRSP
jgi:hypothetical protein